MDKILEELEKKPASEARQNSFIDRIMSLNLHNNLLIGIILSLLVIILILIIFIDYLPNSNKIKENYLDMEILIFIFVGILAQVVDGTLGMGYGATSSSLLLSLGVPPVSISAGIHFAEVFTTGASGISHLKLGNVNKKLFMYLLLPGILGSVIGAYLLADVLDEKLIRPYVAIYVFILGLIFLKKSLRKKNVKKKTKNLSLLALFGGFMDSIGSGGWGPIVTSTLLSQGRNLIYTIGSVNLAEFFVAFSSSFVFVFFAKSIYWKVILGLIIGGLFAAPIAAILVRKINKKILMLVVSILIIILSINNFIKTFN